MTTPKVDTISIDRLPPGLNKLMRMHYRDYQRELRTWTILIREAVGRATPRFKYPFITLVRHYARHPMDVDNRYASAKVVLDALKSLEIIRDDSDGEIAGLRVLQEKVPKVENEKTLITLSEQS